MPLFREKINEISSFNFTKKLLAFIFMKMNSLKGINMNTQTQQVRHITQYVTFILLQSTSLYTMQIPPKITREETEYDITYKRLVPPAYKEIELAQYNKGTEKHYGSTLSNGVVMPFAVPKWHFEELAKLYEAQESAKQKQGL